MRVLLPPSETKRVGGAANLGSGRLHAHDALFAARSAVRAAVVKLSSGDADIAAKALKLGVKNRDEMRLNLELDDAGVLPAIERYTGVLFDALGADTLDPAAREWLDTHVFVQSALFGLVRAGDAIPSYRLSGGTRLPDLESTLKKAWAAAHAPVTGEWQGFILDCRSKDYVALAPLPEQSAWSLTVAQRTADGETRALNHFNKAAKGDLVRRLAVSGASLSSEQDLLAWADAQGLEMTLDSESRTLTLITELGAPTK